jgi:NitT/TauT family transport system substrate-binding protein
MQRRRFLSLSPLLMVPALVVPAHAQAPLRKIRLNILPASEVSPIFAAIKFGWFAAEGLEVDTTPSVGGAAGIPGLVGGAYDIIYSNFVSNVLACARGLDIKGLSAASIGGKAAIVTRKDSGLKRGIDMNGKTFAVNTRNNAIWLYARAWIRATGGDPKKVTFKEVPFPQMQDALLRRQIDVAYQIEPYVTAVEDDPNLVNLGDPLKGVQPEVQIGQYTTTGQFLKSNRDVVDRFLRGQEKGNQWVNAHSGTTELAELITSYSKIPLEITRRLRLAQAVSAISLEEARKTMALMKEAGLIGADLELSTILYAAR